MLVEKLVLAGQSILSLIADLKRETLLSDFSLMNQCVDQRNAEHEQTKQEHETRIQELLALRFEQVTLNFH